jgi:hypothetical protein
MQFLYTLANGDGLFVPPIAHDDIQSLHVEAGEPFTLLKSDRGGKITWSVERVQPRPQLVKGKSKADLMNDLGKVLAGSTEPTPASTALSSTGNGHGSTSQNLNRFYLDRAQRLIDVFAEANKYAAEHHAGAVTKDDVRSLVLSVFIQCTPKAQANGTRG